MTIRNTANTQLTLDGSLFSMAGFRVIHFAGTFSIANLSISGLNLLNNVRYFIWIYESIVVILRFLFSSEPCCHNCSRRYAKYTCIHPFIMYWYYTLNLPINPKANTNFSRNIIEQLKSTSIIQTNQILSMVSAKN